MSTVRWVGRSLWDGRDGDVDDPLDDGARGCPRAAAAGVGAPVVPTRLGPPPPRPASQPPLGLGPMWRWAQHLVPAGEPASLGEGGTPLVALPASVADGVGGRVLVKDERANPTGSFKDRLAAAAVSRARHLGATTVAAASSGNAGLAVAAAAAAGLRAVVLVSGTPPAPTAAELAATGAALVRVGHPDDRWTALRTGMASLGWFPVTNHGVPPVASHPSGVHAYRTIAYEIAEALGWSAPDHVVLPVSRGDGLFGVWAGFAELAALGWIDTVPRMVAVERHPSLGRALARGDLAPATVDAPSDPAVSRSIGDRRGTYMALETLRRSGGLAVTVDDADLRDAAGELARAGLPLETASAAVLPGLRRLATSGALAPTGTTVLVATAGPRAQATLPAPPRPGPPPVDPTDAAALAALAA